MRRSLTGRTRMAVGGLLIALPLSLGTAACSEDEPVDGGGVVEENGEVVEEEEDE
jgi:hypothetical protein